MSASIDRELMDLLSRAIGKQHYLPAKFYLSEDQAWKTYATDDEQPAPQLNQESPANSKPGCTGEDQ